MRFSHAIKGKVAFFRGFLLKMVFPCIAWEKSHVVGRENRGSPISVPSALSVATRAWFRPQKPLNPENMENYEEKKQTQNPPSRVGPRKDRKNTKMVIFGPFSYFYVFFSYSRGSARGGGFCVCFCNSFAFLRFGGFVACTRPAGSQPSTNYGKSPRHAKNRLATKTNLHAAFSMSEP